MRRAPSPSTTPARARWSPSPTAKSRAEIKKILGIESIDTGVFGGILIGLIAAFLFNRYYRISLPAYLGFFAGKRFVPIVVSFAAIALAAVLAVIWPPIGAAIRDFGDWAAYGNPAAAVTIYGVVERMLLPFGLHHIWNVPFFFEVGTYVDPETGKTVHGVLSRFFAGDYEAAILGGGFVFKMFGLPAAAFAIYQTAKPENKARVAGIMGSAALTAFLTGITEPLEFSFLFVAPLLYAVHAVLVGVAYLTTYLLGARLGYSFSHGFIDYALYYVNDIKPWIILILGPIFAAVYYVVFRTLILRLDLKTPGRETETAGRGRRQGRGGGRLRQGTGPGLRRQEQHPWASTPASPGCASRWRTWARPIRTSSRPWARRAWSPWATTSRPSSGPSPTT